MTSTGTTTSTTTTAAAAAPTVASATGLTADPLRFGVGARVTVAVMSDRYAEVVLGALEHADPRGLALQTGDVSTYAGGSEADLLAWLTDLGEAVAASGEHASITVHLSRGCPGEVVCDLPGGAGPRPVEAPAGREVGRYAAAEWALYPLADDVRAGVEPDHMRDIYAAIETARANGTFRASEHFVTRLEGDLGTILATVVAGWTGVGRTVQHVTSHLTVSVNSPSHRDVAA
ncbi:YkoF family thiamine/hydroxymethylpyrimidine-binding protein [Puerhibacterium puerhi]|uniref:YkoF family thiamine/hydroxymethylpyrimidine-binding protein n=1 Tax=Puerhibacterium puerhi TaxID=2692623 RepID=UPI001357F793|nr:YkoF family thiamine/hydroxymethylpyrimidine-binding protein [Puerhibacterium puerhi]